MGNFIEITSDYGRVGRFCWLNSSCADGLRWMTFRLSVDHPLQFHRVWGRRPRFGRWKWIGDSEGEACDTFASEAEALKAKEALTAGGAVRYLADEGYRRYIDAKFARSPIFL